MVWRMNCRECQVAYEAYEGGKGRDPIWIVTDVAAYE